MKTVIKIWLAALLVAGITITYINYAIADVADKYDGDCTGLETAGRCSAIKPEPAVAEPSTPVTVDSSALQPTSTATWGK